MLRVAVLPPSPSPGATKEEVKAAHKKMVLKLHLDKNKNNQEIATELFRRLNSAYEKWRSNTTPAGQGGNNQPAPQPHNHTQIFSSTRHTLDRIFVDKMSRTGRPHNGSNSKAENKIERTKKRYARGAGGCGEQEKVDGQSRSRQPRRHHRDTTQIRLDHCFLERNLGGIQQTYLGYRGNAP